MHEAEKLSLEAMGRFVAASEEIRFEGAYRGQVYGWVGRVLVQQEYAQQGKAARGLLRRYKRYQTPLETLSLLDKPGHYLPRWTEHE